MMMEIFKRIKFWRNADRLGPDIPYTHYKLHFKTTMIKLCSKKFKNFGENSEFRPGAYAISCSNISIGKNIVIRPNTMLFADTRKNGKGIIIEDDVLIGSGVHIYVNNHTYDNPNIPIINQGHNESKEVVLKKGCWICANSIILPGVTIGENSVVGAGSVVTKNVEPKTIVGGIPAKLIKKIK